MSEILDEKTKKFSWEVEYIKKSNQIKQLKKKLN